MHRWNKGCRSQRVAYCAPWVMGLDVLCPHAFHQYLLPFMTEKSFLKTEDTDLFHACHFSLVSNYKVSSWRSGILYRKSIGGQLLANSSSVGKSRSFLSSFNVLIPWFPISIIFLFLLPHSAIGAISPLSSFYLINALQRWAIYSRSLPVLKGWWPRHISHCTISFCLLCILTNNLQSLLSSWSLALFLVVLVGAAVVSSLFCCVSQIS